jgi:diguanylate cyclase (GGDEF)-like protein/PAS domain S-box-containing protein
MTVQVDVLRRVLRAHPDGVVSAIGQGGRPVSVPDTVPLDRHQRFIGSGLDIILPEDQIVVIDHWRLADDEPHVVFKARLLADPNQVATIHVVDARADHGVHVILVEDLDLDLVERCKVLSAQLRHHTARVKKDGVSTFLEIDKATTALLGWTEDDLLGHMTAEFMHPDDMERAVEGWIEMRNGSGRSRVRVRMRHARGHYVWLEVSNENHLDDPDLQCVTSEMVDISDEMSQLEDLQNRERMLARLAEALPIGLCHVRPDREVMYANEPFVALLGEVDSIDSLLSSVDDSDKPIFNAALDNALDGYDGSIEVGLVRDRDERRCELTMRPMTTDDGHIDGVIVCAADVTDRSRLRTALEHRASHDALTGCRNRAAAMTAVELALCEGREVAVAFIDLNGFKAINDSYGHATGDEVLRVAAARLLGATRPDDVVGRLGGDEFVVLCSIEAQFDLNAFAERLRNMIDGDVTFAGRRIPLRASVGAAVSIANEVDAEAVLQRADMAMYVAKRTSGRLVQMS